MLYSLIDCLHGASFPVEVTFVHEATGVKAFVSPYGTYAA
jgi:hypothetical protein